MRANVKEQPLPENGACLLGSQNLVKYVNADQMFDYDKFTKDTALAVRYLDSIIDETIYPLPAQKAEAHAKRRMGIGVTGVANAIELMGFEYGSNGFLNMLDNILHVQRDAAYVSSVYLAKEKGAFPLFDADLYLKGQYAQKLPNHIRTLIGTFGIRNSHLMSIAPTGTISLCADNISSGIEPVFTHEYERTIQTPTGPITEKVYDYAYRNFGLKGKTALELTPEEHIRVLAVAQRYCDSAVSKTVNIGDDVTYEQFKDVYMQAYKAGAKGCTTFRAAGKRLGILTAKSEDKPEADSNEQEGFSFPISPAEEATACTFDSTTGRKTCE